MSDMQAILAFVGVVITALGLWLGKRMDRQNQLIDQLQEERTTQSEKVGRLIGIVEELRTEVHELSAAAMLWRVIYERQNLIIQGLGGEAVPLPPLLRDRDRKDRTNVD